jgi:hypothetical protein
MLYSDFINLKCSEKYARMICKNFKFKTKHYFQYQRTCWFEILLSEYKATFCSEGHLVSVYTHIEGHRISRDQ